MPAPARFPSGLSTDFPFGPLGAMGLPNPLFYHLWWDDMDQEISESGYTKTTSGNGTVALAAGDGGVGLFTTNSSTPLITDVASLQLPAAGFSVTAGKKMFFLARVQLSSISNANLLLGLIQTTTTPFTVVDGIYFLKPTGALTGLVLNVAKASVVTSTVIPVSAYTLANNVNIDLGFHVDRAQNVYAYVGSQLVGYLPQSGTGANNASGVPAIPAPGPVAALQQAAVPTAMPVVNLNPTMALGSGTAASSTMTVDFALAAKER